jgi:hypothetical protein
MNAIGHWECKKCTTQFWTSEAAVGHMNDYNHCRPEFKCEACNDAFDTIGEAKRHMHQERHWRNHWCSDCERGFESESNLRAVSIR